MTELLRLTDELKTREDSYETKARVTELVCKMIKDAKRPLPQDVASGLVNFAIEEVKKLTAEIPVATTYKQKDEMFGYCDALFTLIALSDAEKSLITEEQTNVIHELISINDRERTLENAVSNAFEVETPDEPEVRAAIKITESVTEPYRRGLFFYGLHHYADNLDRATDAAKNAIAEFTVKEFNALLSKQDLIDDESNYLEYAADVCKHYFTDEIGDALERVMAKCDNNVRYYAVDTLLSHKRNVTAEAVDKLARDLSYADITYSMLKKYGKLDLFPKDCLDAEYLALSNMVRWLEYPTELGKRPDKIELLGKAKKHGEEYRIYKYMTDSDNLSDDLHNIWLVGWANRNGRTFSTFDKLSDYEKKTPEKTLKYIVKKLI